MRKSGLRQSTILVKQWDCGGKHARIVATLEMLVGNEARTASISEAVRQEAICESSTRGSTGKGWLNLGDGTTGMAIMLPKREALWLTKP
ncbi:hypothetical protein V1477_003787 [Vespula maculifrons]|uniref:Uncharacterized protein n=1 Tax=Vespula maculifrons TaxID=7453 RepID=A0ABD2CS25_VESMC